MTMFFLGAMVMLTPSMVVLAFVLWKANEVRE